MNLQAYIALGWSPVLAVATTNGSAIEQVIGWIGGNGTAPVTGQYIGSTGFVTNITDGQNIAATGTISAINVSASNTSANLTNLVFSNSNGVTFGLSGSTITASAAGGGGGAAISAGANSQNTGTVNFSNSNGVTFGLSNNGVMTASIGNFLTTAAQSNQVVNSLNGSTGQISLNVGSSLSSSTNGSSITFGLASNITTALQSTGNYLTTAMQSNAATISNIKISAGASSSNVSAITFNNANGVSFGYDGTNITASVAPAGGAQTGISGIGAGGATATSGTVIFSNSNNVSFGMNGQTMTASIANYLTTADLSQNSSKYIQNWKLTGNTAGTTSSAQGTDLWLAGGNGVTISGSSNTLSFSVATNYQSQGAYLTTADLSQNSSNYVRNWKLTGNTAGTTSSAQGTDLWLAGGNGVTISGSSNTLSFSVATNYQSQGAYLTTAMQSNAATISNINISAGVSSANVSAITFSNANGITFGYDKTNITASYTVPSVTQYFSNTATTFNGANISGSMTLNTAGLQLSLSAAAPGAGGSLNVSASNTSVNLTNIYFSNANGVNWGLNGSTMTASYTQQIFSNSNGVTFGTNGGNGVVTASVAAGGYGGAMNWYALSNTTQGTSATLNTSAISLNAAGGMSVGLTNGSVMLSAPPVSSLSATGMVSISTNGSTISIGAAETPKSYYANIEIMNALTALSEGASSNFVMPMVIPYDISFNQVRIPMSLSLGSSSFATTANTTIGLSQSVTYFINIYSLGTGANSRSLQYVIGTSITNQFNVTAQVGAASNNQTVGQSLTYVQPGTLGTSQFTATYNLNATTIAFSTTGLTSFNGLRWFDMPFASSLSGGAYWLGIQRSTTQSTSGTNMSGAGITKFNLYMTQVNSNIAAWGVASNASTDGYYIGLGLWSTNTNGTTSSSMALGNISTQASQPMLPIQFIRQA